MLDLVGSLDHTSLSSSLGDLSLSTSLRSTHELKNLQSLVTNPPVAGSSSMMTSSTSDNDKNARNFS